MSLTKDGETRLMALREACEDFRRVNPLMPADRETVLLRADAYYKFLRLVPPGLPPTADGAL